MGLLDVNVFVALAWDAHVHHVAARRWFVDHASDGWATCPITESGFVRVSSNPRVLAHPIAVADARAVLAAFRARPGHRFVADDVSECDSDVPPAAGHRQVTDAHLVTVAARARMKLVTFDRAILALADADRVMVLDRS